MICTLVSTSALVQRVPLSAADAGGISQVHRQIGKIVQTEHVDPHPAKRHKNLFRRPGGERHNQALAATHTTTRSGWTTPGISDLTFSRSAAGALAASRGGRSSRPGRLSPGRAARSRHPFLDHGELHHPPAEQWQARTSSHKSTPPGALLFLEGIDRPANCTTVFRHGAACDAEQIWRVAELSRSGSHFGARHEFGATHVKIGKVTRTPPAPPQQRCRGKGFDART